MGTGAYSLFIGVFAYLTIFIQALEEGEDIQELSERAKDKKERRAHNKLLKEDSARNTPSSDVVVDGRGRKPKKGKAKANDYESGTGSSKRKRGIKSLSASPDADDDDDDHDTVCLLIT